MPLISVCVHLCVRVVCSCASLASLQLHRAAMASLCLTSSNNAFRQVFCLLKSIRNFLCDLTSCLSVEEVHNSLYNSICIFSILTKTTKIGFNLLLILMYLRLFLFDRLNAIFNVNNFNCKLARYAFEFLEILFF